MLRPEYLFAAFFVFCQPCIYFGSRFIAHVLIHYQMNSSPLSSKTKSDQIKIAFDVMRALAHPLRLDILQFINEKETCCVNDIYVSLNIEQSIASQHLRILRQANLVSTLRSQKFVYYSVNYEKLQVASTSSAILRQFVKSVQKGYLAPSMTETA